MADTVVVDDGTTSRDAKGEWVPARMRAAPGRGTKALLVRQIRTVFGFPGLLWPWPAMYAGLALITWLYLQPGAAVLGFNDLSRFELRFDWLLLMYARNVALAILIYGGWHLPLYWQRIQGTRFKYNRRWLTRNSKAFLFRNQLWDNLFWTLVSGVGIWTIYEALMLWAYAEGWLAIMEFRNNPIWFVALFPVITIWNDFHFYFVHRLLHWKPLYRAAHYLHHRNVNVGPWSGLAMHPLEHVIYLTRWLILLVVPSHPLHMIYVMHWAALGAAPGHTGLRGDGGAQEGRRPHAGQVVQPLPPSPLLRVQLQRRAAPARPPVRDVPRRQPGGARAHAGQTENAAGGRAAPLRRAEVQCESSSAAEPALSRPPPRTRSRCASRG